MSGQEGIAARSLFLIDQARPLIDSMIWVDLNLSDSSCAVGRGAAVSVGSGWWWTGFILRVFSWPGIVGPLYADITRVRHRSTSPLPPPPLSLCRVCPFIDAQSIHHQYDLPAFGRVHSTALQVFLLVTLTGCISGLCLSREEPLTNLEKNPGQGSTLKRAHPGSLTDRYVGFFKLRLPE